MRNIIHLLAILLLLNVVFVVSENPNGQRHPSAVNNQRSADSGYKYAWFTRDIHDEDEQQLSPQRILRMQMLKSLFDRKYPKNDETLSESNEKL